MNATQNVQVFSSFRQPQKNFRQQQSHQRAVAVKDRLLFLKKNFCSKRSRTSTDSQHKKMGKQSIWFSEKLIGISSILVTKDKLEDTLT